MDGDLFSVIGAGLFLVVLLVVLSPRLLVENFTSSSFPTFSNPTFLNGIVNYILAFIIALIIVFVIGPFILSIVPAEKLSDDMHVGMGIISFMAIPLFCASVGLVVTYVIAVLFGGHASFESFYHATSTYAPALAVLLFATPFILTFVSGFLFPSVSYFLTLMVWFGLFNIYSILVTKETVSIVMKLDVIQSYIAAGVFLILAVIVLFGPFIGPISATLFSLRTKQKKAGSKQLSAKARL